jgi:endonuclease/exonuclease/phosphatase family metal-dependent hydrolase
LARAERLRVATYNVENYLATDRLIEKTFRTDYPKPEAAKAALRSVIHSAGADVLILQEMGGPAYLKELQRDLAAEGRVYEHTQLMEGEDPDRHVAVLSNKPFGTVRKHTDLAFEYFGKVVRPKRGLLEVRLKFGAEELTIFAVHLKSRYTDRSDDPLSGVRRAGEANAMRERILALFPKPDVALYLIAGDLNDGPRSKPVTAFTHRGKTAVAEILPATDTRGETWTHVLRREDSYSRVDYVLVSPGLRPRVVGGNAMIVDVPHTHEASDHRPVVVELELGGVGG